ncbi:MAG: hypothetical protein HYV09_15990 [Deltaproteobacteria bacterium]|nr:hypothetical protein [Deltaproteobacteria bacterium]
MLDVRWRDPHALGGPLARLASRTPAFTPLQHARALASRAGCRCRDHGLSKIARDCLAPDADSTRPPPMKANAPLQFLVLLAAGWLQRAQADAIAFLLAENRVLRARLGDKRLRLSDAERKLLAQKGRPLGMRVLRSLASLATPETIFRWYRELVAKKYDGSRRRRPPTPGRPPTAVEIAHRLLAIARQNPSWGYTRLRGAMANLGHDLARNTIARILRENGLEPAPRRGKTMPWRTFLKAHAGAIAAADFFSVEVLTRGGLVRYLVLFLIDLKSRRVHVAGISHSIDGAFMARVARDLTAFPEDFLGGIKKLIVDRDPLYTEHFQRILRDAGVELLRLPPRSPNLKGDVSHYTSFARFDEIRRPRRRRESLVPCCLRGVAPASVA